MIGSSSARIKERLTDGDVIVVEIFREPLLGQRLLGVLDICLRAEVVVGLIPCGGVLFGQGAKFFSGSARACYPRHEGSRRCKAAGSAENKTDEEKGDEVNGEVEEVTQRAHET